MCLETVHTNIGKQLTIRHLPANELIKGWKVVSGINEPALLGVTSYHLTGLYARSLYFKKRWNKAEPHMLYDGQEPLYRTGFHVFAEEYSADLYIDNEGPFAYIIPVYYKKKNIKTTGTQIKEVVFVLDEMYIKPKDYRRIFKQYKKDLQIIK